MTQEIKIEKKASDVIQPRTVEDARQAIRTKQDLSGAKLRGMHLAELNAVGAILRKTDLADADLSHSLLVNPNFYKASLHQTAVNNTVFLGGDLVKTSFLKSNLSDSALIGVDAQNASFKGANLRNAGLISADLRDTDFTEADLTNARLVYADVEGADFSGAVISGARYHNVNWSKAKVPPGSLPAPLVVLPKWVLPIVGGALLGTAALIIYSLARKKRKR